MDRLDEKISESRDYDLSSNFIAGNVLCGNPVIAITMPWFRLLVLPALYKVRSLCMSLHAQEEPAINQQEIY